jgi:hypothetical protein
MIPHRPTRLAPLLVVAGCLVGLLLAVYVGGYFVLDCTAFDQASGIRRLRNYGDKWLCTIYCPVAFIEAKLTCKPVYLQYPDVIHSTYQP